MPWHRVLGERGRGAVLRSSTNAVRRGIARAARDAHTWDWYARALRRLAVGAVVLALALQAWRWGVRPPVRTARSVDTLSAAAGLTVLLTAGGSGIARRWADGARRRMARLEAQLRELER